MDKIFIPARSPEAWKPLLAEPDKQWKKGYSARALASCWQDATGFPESVKRVFAESGIVAFEDLEMLLGIPEHQVPLPGGARPTQTDLWVLARSRSGLISIAVEGKVSEPFGPMVGEWLKDASPGKIERLAFLQKLLQLPDPVPEDVRYQLLHRTASAVLEAKRFLAGHAVMLVHSFSQTHEWFEDYARFARLFGVDAQLNRVHRSGRMMGVDLFFAWVCGEERFLSA
jgi:uncharacterized protein DUF6946